MSRLLGDWAIGIWDSEGRRLFCAKDAVRFRTHTTAPPGSSPSARSHCSCCSMDGWRRSRTYGGLRELEGGCMAEPCRPEEYVDEFVAVLEDVTRADAVEPARQRLLQRWPGLANMRPRWHRATRRSPRSAATRRRRAEARVCTGEATGRGRSCELHATRRRVSVLRAQGCSRAARRRARRGGAVDGCSRAERAHA